MNLKNESIIALKSREGVLIEIPINLALQSKTLKTILTHNCFIENETKTIMLPFTEKIVLKGVEYMTYKLNNESFDDFKIPDEDALDILQLSNYLRL